MLNISGTEVSSHYMRLPPLVWTAQCKCSAQQKVLAHLVATDGCCSDKWTFKKLNRAGCIFKGSLQQSMTRDLSSVGSMVS